MSLLKDISMGKFPDSWCYESILKFHVIMLNCKDGACHVNMVPELELPESW